MGCCCALLLRLLLPLLLALPHWRSQHVPGSRLCLLPLLSSWCVLRSDILLRDKRMQVGRSAAQLLLWSLRPRLRPHWLLLRPAAGVPRWHVTLPRSGRLGCAWLQRGPGRWRASEARDPGRLPR